MAAPDGIRMQEKPHAKKLNKSVAKKMKPITNDAENGAPSAVGSDQGNANGTVLKNDQKSITAELPWICSGCTRAPPETCGKTESECLIALQRQVDSERLTRTTRYRGYA